MYGDFCKHVLTSDFFENVWGTCPRIFRDQGVPLFPKPTADDMFAASVLCPRDKLRLFMKQGEVSRNESSLSDFALSYLQKGSLVLNQVDRLLPSVYNLCQELGSAQFLHCFAVAYLTPSHSAAVVLHSDDQDVFICQVWGQKSWQIYPKRGGLIYSEEVEGKSQAIDESTLADPIMEDHLNEGDVLYIPRGFLHRAHTKESPSFHLTLTVPTSASAFGVLLERQIAKALRTRMSPLVDAFLRSSVTPWKLKADHKDDWQDKLNIALKDLPSLIKVDDLVKQALVEGQQVNSFQKKQHLSLNAEMLEEETYLRNYHDMGHYVSGHGRPHAMLLSNYCRVRMAPGVCCMCEPNSRIALFCRCVKAKNVSEKLQIEIDPQVSPLIFKIPSGSERPILVADLPCRDDFEKLCLLSVLFHKQVIQIFSHERKKSPFSADSENLLAGPSS